MDLGDDIILWNMFSLEMCTNIVSAVCFTKPDACLAVVVLNLVYIDNNGYSLAGTSSLQFIVIIVMLCRQSYYMYARHCVFTIFY